MIESNDPKTEETSSDLNETSGEEPNQLPEAAAWSDFDEGHSSETAKFSPLENCGRLAAVAGPSGRITQTLPALEAKQSLRELVRLMVYPFTRMHQIPVFRRVWLYTALMGI